MRFTNSQKAYIKKVFDDINTVCSKYALVYKPNNEYKTTWSLIDNPTWDWEHYEYRLLKYLDRPLVKSEVEDVYVYCYNGMVYYNDPNNELHMSYLVGKSAIGSLTTAMAVGGDFNVYGNNATFGDSNTYDAVVKIVGTTKLNTDETKNCIGPKIKFQASESSKDGFISITYSDKMTNEFTGLLDPAKRPSIKLESLNDNEYLCIPRKENLVSSTVTNKTVTNLDGEKATFTSLTAALYFTDVQQICKTFFPIGCFYWTSDETFNPATKFGGNWEKVEETFMYAMAFADNDVKTAQHGEAQHTLSWGEYAKHTHTLVDNQHNHGTHYSPHNHTINDSGHMHSIRTIGDDYNGSNCWGQGGTGNFVQDGWWDMTWTNWNRGIRANNNKTNIKINNGVTGISINQSNTGLWLDESNGGGQPHNNMPPYLRAFCWHRIG